MTGLSDTSVAELGAALYAARRSGVPIEPLTDAHPAMSMRDAYRVADTIADLASSGAVVLGSVVSPVDATALRLAGMVFTRDSEVVATGAGAAALGGPLQAAAWLARTLASLGESLRAGQFIMTGALHAALDITPGQCFCAEVDRLGPVTIRIA